MKLGSAPPPLQMDSRFNTELLWRYPLLLHGGSTPSTPPSHTPIGGSLLELTAHLPHSLRGDPRGWNREDVASFLRWFQQEFDLPNIDTERFRMNGKALCLLTKEDVRQRAPGAGDILHNALQMLLRDLLSPHSRLPMSPIIPASPSPFTTTSTPSGHWPDLSSIQHFLSGTPTLSPPPSSDSQSGSPRHPEENGSNGNNSSNSSHYSSYPSGGPSSDSEDSLGERPSPQHSPVNLQVNAPATPTTPAPHYHHQRQQEPPPPSQPNQGTVPDPLETGSSGRLLWDFLQQLLNDPAGRYTRFIAWKNRETGVFKIMDPAGLARLWGIQKNHLSMNYDKMSRALRYYYRVNILKKVQGERHCYQFLRNPSELRSIKNISLLRQNIFSQIKTQPVATQDEGPTDLSMPHRDPKVESVQVKQEPMVYQTESYPMSEPQ